MKVRILFVVLFATLEHIISDDIFTDDILPEPLLTKSLGYSIRKSLDSKTLEDAKLNKEFTYQYQEMIKASRESFENVSGKEDKRLRRVVGDHNYEMMKEDVKEALSKMGQQKPKGGAIRLQLKRQDIRAGVLDRRRSAPRLESPVGIRRARTQALRRQKLNSQSLNSHLQHARHTTPETEPDISSDQE